MAPQQFFTLEHTDATTQARVGTIQTDHGAIPTPAFMPVGTQGAVKALEWQNLNALEAPIVLSNTYHLYLRPGTDVLDRVGGLHAFNGWSKPILTDSGGFQVWSLRDLRKLSEHGVEFRSHLDGSAHVFTPESVVDIQRSIGSDLFMVLDECTPYPVSETDARISMERTVRWAERAANHHAQAPFHHGHRQFQFAIGQGSVYPALREACMKSLVEMNFDGYAIGGLSVGESADEMYAMTEVSTRIMPANKPRYLMGVGTPENILRSIALGVDMFDCVMPTRNARNGTVFTTTGKVNVKNAKWKYSTEVLDDGVGCATSAITKMAYLRHLFVANEILGLILATTQNVAFYLWLVRNARKHILEGTYSEWSQETIRIVSSNR